MGSLRVTRRLARAAFLTMALLVASCEPGAVVTGPPGTITGVEGWTPTIEKQNSYVVTIGGTGACTIYRIDWGDGKYDIDGWDFGSRPTRTLSHIYTGWGGTKTISVEGINNCSGKAQTSVAVQPSTYKLAIVAENLGLPGGSAPQTSPGCFQDAGMPLLRERSVVTLSSDPDSKIDFGCILSGCVYGIDGEPNSIAPQDYPFPGMRKYSLIVKLGSQIVQAGDFVSFTATQSGRMEMCVNDNDFGGNSRGWVVVFEVAEPPK